MRKGAIIARRYSLAAFIAGSLYGILLGVLSAYGVMDTLSPVARGIAGLVTSGILGVIVAPLGAGFRYPLTRGIVLEASIVSILSSLVLWVVVYASLVG
ncbi:MAG: hypothetical protein GSR74_02795 [Desulfurococcales archaeon]|nr:hypothetical protein [Desulfurococcales archaeon]